MDDLLDYDEDNPAPDIPPAADEDPDIESEAVVTGAKNTRKRIPIPSSVMAHQQMLPQNTRRLT